MTYWTTLDQLEMHGFTAGRFRILRDGECYLYRGEGWAPVGTIALTARDVPQNAVWREWYVEDSEE